jgi:carboxymethylenebutenolidase
MTPATQPVRIPIDGSTPLPAALALPARPSQLRPGVIVIHEILGLNDDIRRITARFAAEGYVAVAPDLFAGLGPKPICTLRVLVQYWKGEGRAWEVLEATRRWLDERPEVDSGRVGVAGFCMGGGFALLMAVKSPVGAAAAFYGDVPRRIEALRGTCPVIAGYGGRDKYFARQGRRLERFLRELGIPHDVLVLEVEVANTTVESV